MSIRRARARVTERVCAVGRWCDRVSLPELYAWLASAGFPGCMALALYLSLSGRVRWAREFDAMVAAKDQQIALLTEDRDWWKDVGSRTLDMNERVTTATAAAVNRRKS